MNQRQIALEILYKTIKDESYSNLLMRKQLEQVPPIQRGFITNLVNGVLRKFEILRFQFVKEINDKTSFKLQLILCMALYERFFLFEKDYVVNNEYVNLCTNKFDKAFINAMLHKINSFKQTNIAYAKYCLPEWIYNLLSSQYDESTLLNILSVYQNVPKVYYRINKSKCCFDDLKDLDINIENEDVFTSKNNLIHTSLYSNGYFYIQDFNSASLYSHLDLKPNNTLLDICSAPGSKLFNCLDIIETKNCYANDLYEHRVELIKKMASKLGFSGINYLNYDGTKLNKIIDMKFDRILLDAPCSGLGVIGRKPDLKFHIKPNSLDELQNLQYDLLNTAKQLLNKEGILLYSTCTLNRKENDRMIRKFLSSALDFVLIEEETIINNLGDCFYYAKLKKVK